MEAAEAIAPDMPAGPANDAARPHLFFFSELDVGGLLAALRAPGTLDALASLGAGVALSLTELDDAHAEAARLLAERGIPTVAWLCLPAADGFTLSLPNYPRALARYQALKAWAQERGLRFSAIGLDIEPPPGEAEWSTWRALRDFASGLWLARDNALYPSARAAYLDLVAAIRHDGYEVHSYQVPLLADDRRAGTTLMQRALDIVDLPADVDVLMCSSDVPVEWLGGDLGGALVASYGPVADAIGVGALDPLGGADEPLSWEALRRDLLLAAQHTDTIYIASLEHCVRAGLLPKIEALDWAAPARPVPLKRAVVGAARLLLLGLLLAARVGPTTLAWAGWVLALVLWLRGRRGRRGR